MSVAKLVDLLRKEGLKSVKNQYYGLELATVVSPFPNIKIVIDGMDKIELTEKDLIICHRLLNYPRAVSINSIPVEERELNYTRDDGKRKGTDTNSISKKDGGELTGSTGSASCCTSHAHPLAGYRTFGMKDGTVSLSYAELKFEDILLKTGDRILVQGIQGGQKYVIMDRVVEYVQHFSPVQYWQD